MKSKKMFFNSILPAFLSLLISISCQEKKSHKEDKQKEISKPDTAQNLKGQVVVDTSGCDPNIWKYVYNPERLEVIDKCKTITGVIEESNADDDGDQHMLLRLDAGQENLLRERNMKKKDGNLVIEAVCMNDINRHKVGDVCSGYVNHVQLPEVGNHVKVTGSYVIDSHNGWAEIHPITKIEVLK